MIPSAPSPMTGSANMSAVLGGTQSAPQQGNIAEEIRAVMRQIRELNMQIDGIAQSFPVASEKLDASKNALMEAMKAIIANQTGPEPASPQVLG